MIVASLILGVSLIISAVILFCGLVNQETQVSYVAPTTQELMVELLKRTTKEVDGLAGKIKSIVETPAKETADVGKGPVTV